jgi:hypothetical protein
LGAKGCVKGAKVTYQSRVTQQSGLVADLLATYLMDLTASNPVLFFYRQIRRVSVFYFRGLQRWLKAAQLDCGHKPQQHFL